MLKKKTYLNLKVNRIHPHLGEQTKKKNKKSFNQDKYFQILKKKNEGFEEREGGKVEVTVGEGTKEGSGTSGVVLEDPLNGAWL